MSKLIWLPVGALIVIVGSLKVATWLERFRLYDERHRAERGRPPRSYNTPH